jgi:hypothetical protein
MYLWVNVVFVFTQNLARHCCFLAPYNVYVLNYGTFGIVVYGIYPTTRYAVKDSW